MTKRLLGSSGQPPVYLVPYDVGWPSRFDEERAVLQRALAPWLVGPIEHIGSTAVPGLVAKPVIDIMAAVETLDGSRGALPVLAEHTYVYFPWRKDVMHCGVMATSLAKWDKNPRKNEKAIPEV